MDDRPLPEPPKSQKRVIVVAAALIGEDDKILLAQRGPGKHLEGMWEFPGGKVEEGEGLEFALARELEEELDIKVSASDLVPLTFTTYDYGHTNIFLPLYICREWKGEARSREGQALSWVSIDNFGDYEMPPADIPLIEPLKELLLKGEAGKEEGKDVRAS